MFCTVCTVYTIYGVVYIRYTMYLSDTLDPKDPNRPRDVAVFRGVGVLTSRTLKSWGRACETPGACFCPCLPGNVAEVCRIGVGYCQIGLAVLSMFLAAMEVASVR